MPKGVHLLSPQRNGPSTETSKLIDALGNAGLIEAYTPLTSCCWIDLARGELLHEFMKVGYSHALWLDADVSCGLETIRAMLVVGEHFPVVAMTYPRRGDGKLCVETISDVKPRAVGPHRVLRIKAAGLGLTLTDRESMEDLCSTHEHLRTLHPSDPRESYVNPFMHSIVDHEFYGDDRSFFHRLRSLEIPIVTILDQFVTHDGSTSTFTFRP